MRTEADRTWSTYWLCVNNELVPRTAARLGYHQTELATAERLIGYVRTVQWNTLASVTKPTPTEEPTALAPATEAFSRDSVQRSVHIFLDATKMARTASHRWTQRNSCRTTNQLDHSRRSFAIKVLHGNIPRTRDAAVPPRLQQGEPKTHACLHTWVYSQSTNNHRVKGKIGPRAVLATAHRTQALEPTAMVSEQ
ncbi:hypothetical protein GGI25_006454 [Coemansia spiralis]|uniref:Uncharacterized protein n=1 Tax=Coemansia spiralis TaxID=417178 RepID=A0A9W8KV49_9FUNG|nr:hypothetical protein GGI26_003116 [Coemansia sp. RSA 1358]KAJ2668385.1 hypothetical protein GGI25_006454 [Coemansia spiralis]